MASMTDSKIWILRKFCRVQIDVLHTDNDGEDDTWNAIWEVV
jgi:hypothetical protein